MRQTEAIYTGLCALGCDARGTTNECLSGFPHTLDVAGGSANHLMIGLREHVSVAAQFVEVLAVPHSPLGFYYRLRLPGTKGLPTTHT